MTGPEHHLWPGLCKFRLWFMGFLFLAPFPMNHSSWPTCAWNADSSSPLPPLHECRQPIEWSDFQHSPAKNKRRGKSSLQLLVGVSPLRRLLSILTACMANPPPVPKVPGFCTAERKSHSKPGDSLLPVSVLCNKPSCMRKVLLHQAVLGKARQSVQIKASGGIRRGEAGPVQSLWVGLCCSLAHTARHPCTAFTSYIFALLLTKNRVRIH